MNDNNFCNACGSLLISSLSSDKNSNDYVSRCYKCSKEYPLRNNITGYTKSKNDNAIYNQYIEAGKHDNTYPQIEKICDNCKNPIMVFFTKDNLKKVYICQKCGYFK